MTQPTYSFTPISPPGVAASNVTGINDFGVIIGYEGGIHSDLFTYSGAAYTPVPDPTIGVGQFAFTGAINDFGDYVVYSASIQTGMPLSFENGSPLPVPANAQGIQASGINNSGQIVGTSGTHGFLYSGGNFTTIDDPSAASTNPRGINNFGEIVGSYLDNHNLLHGFLDINGSFTTLDDPLATNGTVATAINDTGQIVGYYQDVTGGHGFLYSNGHYITLDDPLATGGTALTGINNSGEIVGHYNANNNTHGFLATPFDPGTAGTIVFTAEYGTAPGADEFNVLVQFTDPQYAYGQQIGVMDPAVFAYESLGVTLASTATHFQNTFGPSNSTYPGTPAGDTKFATDAYASVFGHAAGPAQVQHFVDQLIYFETLYTAAGVFGNATNIDLLARGAIYGQMLGIAHEVDPTAFGDPAGIVGISPTTAHGV